MFQTLAILFIIVVIAYMLLGVGIDFNKDNIVIYYTDIDNKRKEWIIPK